MSLKQLSEKSSSVAYGLASAAFFALMATFVRLSKNQANHSELLLLRAIGSIIILSLICKKDLINLFRPGSEFVWTRSMFGGLSVLCLYWNLQHISAGLSVLLSDLAPIFIVLFQIIAYRVFPQFLVVLGIILAMVGILVLGTPKSSEASVLNLLIGISGSFFAACAYISLKKAVTKYKPSTITFAFSTVMLLVSARELFELPEIIARTNIYYILGIITCSLIAQILMNKSYSNLAAYSAATLTLTSSAWALLADLLVFQQIPGILTMLGFILTLIGVTLVICCE